MAAGRRMNLGLQKNVIKRKLRNAGLKPDRVDLEQELDSTLRLNENIANLKKKYGRLSGIDTNTRERERKTVERQRKAARRQAKSIHRDRPRWNRRIDESKQAEKVFRNPTERQFEKWRSNPDLFDIEGVDTKKPVEERTVADFPSKQEENDVIWDGGIV